MTASTLRRATAVITGVVLLSASAGPALARSDGEMPGQGLDPVRTLLIFAGIPLGLSALIALLVVGGGLRHRPRYRPGRPWDHEPVWFAGPRDPNTALAAGRPNVTAGGASAEW